MIKIITSFVIILAAWFALASITYPPTQVSTNGGSTYATTYKFDFPAGSQSGTIFTLGVIPASYGGTGLSSVGSSGNILTSNGSVWVSSSPAYTGTVTSVNLTSASFPALQFNGGPITGSGVITASYSGTPISIAFGGTGTTTAQLAINALAGAETSGQYLRGNGTNVVMSAIQAADVPTLNQNTTGVASYVNLTANSTNATFYIPFVSADTSGSYPLQVTSIEVNASTNTLSNVAWGGSTITASNGGTGATTLGQGGVLVGQTTSAIQSVVANAAGELLTSVGSASNPAWSSSPTLGVNGTTTGALSIATASTSGASVTLTNLGTTSAYNFVFPTTVGTSGQVLTSSGSSSVADTWSSALINPCTQQGCMITMSSVPAIASLPLPASYGTGAVMISSGSEPAWSAPGTVGQVLAVPGVGSAPVFASMAYSNISSAITTASYSTFLSNSGSQAGVLFSITAPGSNVSAGAVYTNNSGSFTVLNAVTTSQSGWILFTTNTSTAPSGSTLTKSSGTGPSTITFGAAQQLEAYTTPSSPSPITLHITMAGAGGGGGSSGTGSTNAGTGGLPTSLCSSAGVYFVANGGAGGNGGASTTTVGGAGGTNTSDGGSGDILSPGGSGAGPIAAVFGSIVYSPGGSGGINPLAGGAAGNALGTSNAGAVNTGAGGAGGGTGGASSSYAGGGGGAGAYQDFWLTNPSATYYYSVGSTGSGTGGGAGGAAGSSGNAGGQGGSGYLRIIAEFQ